ncbi:S-adenosyl-L-methionine-dependent methyltransferase [Calocera viscosa TUFC12733]|uniref:S-adenosyl-L-methionine-dependent methyltransferase n=1 Tax=Calocera viscosa (strain TUFC12733) TaxID=1330018 RepID=A0A167PPA7_CALVF|nr:S-adenosyl-L-methionine-dependent methyltransferase [Calocera viscosa TUFC12733]
MATGVDSRSARSASDNTLGDEHQIYHNADTPYPLPTGADSGEAKRLNAQHYGIKTYFAGNNAGAKWPDNPKRILEISVGSGTWAREVAEQFPDAEVIGVDISEPKLEKRPPNFRFKLLNLIKDPWPFEPDTFDIVHCRFLTMHIPGFKFLLDNAIKATAPGGILMFEDLELRLKSDKKPLPSPVALFDAVFRTFTTSAGIDDLAGSKFASIITASGKFSETHETVVPAPMGTWTDDKKLHSIGLGMQTGFVAASRSSHPRLAQFGFSRETIEELVAQALNNENRLYMDVYFVWARKKVLHL